MQRRAQAEIDRCDRVNALVGSIYVFMQLVLQQVVNLSFSAVQDGSQFQSSASR